MRRVKRVCLCVITKRTAVTLYLRENQRGKGLGKNPARTDSETDSCGKRPVGSVIFTHNTRPPESQPSVFVLYRLLFSLFTV